MDSIVNKLSEIESAATAIIDHAEEQKESLETEYQKKREDFDTKLEADTQKKLKHIRQELESRTSSVLGNQSGTSNNNIDAIKKEFEDHHTEYAQQILARITEV